MSDYNGWTNYETWNWKLWMDNDYGTYTHWREVTKGVIEDTGNDEEEWIYNISKLLKEDCETYLESIDVVSLTTGPFADLLGFAISRINWYEIAEIMVGDYDEGN